MTASEIVKLSAINYQCITALNSIAYEIIQNGEIISEITVDPKRRDTILVIKIDNFLYKLYMHTNDSCKSITWERGS